jgi:hypothetical protein
MSLGTGTHNDWRSRRNQRMAEEATQKTEENEETEELKIERPPRAKLTADEVRKRMEEFPKRRDRFIASIRKGKS